MIGFNGKVGCNKETQIVWDALWVYREEIKNEVYM